MRPDQQLYETQLNGQTVIVQKVAIEQDISHRHYGKWVVRHLATGRRLHRSTRQLYPHHPPPEGRAA